MRYAYPYELTSQPEGGFTVTFPDVPEAITQGDNEKEAAAMAEDALVTALSFYTDQAEGLPHPSPAHGRPLAYVPPLVAAKLALHDAMLTAGVSNVALARQLPEMVGQDHLLGPDGPIGRMVGSGQLASMILWGPPGCGKTTIARLLADGTDLVFEPLSAVFSGVADLRKVFDGARKRREMGQGTLLFVDEIHRFNRAQQDAFLPVVEDGTVILVGATTENPSFELIGALLSRAQVFVLRRLDDAALETLLGRAEQNLGHALPLTDDGRAALRAMADGDGRFLLNLVEEIDRLPREPMLGPQQLAELVQRRAPLYDKQQEGHYNLISALHKSLRGSDTDAALYWLARMLAGGEDPIYILRRLTRAAVEDIGLAEPQAVG